MTNKKTNPKNNTGESAAPITPYRYREPGETPGRREGLSPDGQPLEELNTKEKEIGGLPDEEPTRYGDWVSKGRCTDF